MSDFNAGSLLSEYGLFTVKDYDDFLPRTKMLFCRRLFNCLDKKIDLTLKELKNNKASRVINFHYLINLDKQDSSITNLPNKTLLKKASFFAVKTIITFPFYEYKRTQLVSPCFPILGRKIHQKTTEIVETDVSDFHSDRLYSLLQLLCNCRDLLSEGLVQVILVHKNNYHKIFKSLNQECKLVSANFELEKLLHQFEEPSTDTYLLQPHFISISSKDIITLKKEEADIYIDFENYLCTLLDIDVPKTNIEENLFKELEKISHGFNKITEKLDVVFRKEQRCKTSLQVFCALWIISFLCPNLLCLPSVLNTILTSAGSDIFTQIIATFIGLSFFDYKFNKDDIKNEDSTDYMKDVYLTLILANPKAKRYLSKHKKKREKSLIYGQI